ncbi:MAG: Fe(2+)-trafficking protein [Phycisphaerales bacterium]|jgi:Fe-S cluster biosynthesis and repair protein YggX|nr:Fe(2+)-trafficking protein [Phycisphaerales bacterium]
MRDTLERIERFETMVTADPMNDMAHFSLGSAYLESERFAEAAASFQTCVGLNPDMTRAMELGGSALMQAGQKAEAETLLRQGFMQAVSRGEMKVKEGITAVLRAAGLPIPEMDTAAPSASGTGKPLEKAPLPGAVGDWIAAHVLSDAWEGWIAQGTKVINELRLDFSREEDQKVYEEYMIEFLRIPQEIVDQDHQQKKEAVDE